MLRGTPYRRRLLRTVDCWVLGRAFGLLCDTLPVPLVRSHGSDDHGLKENSPLRMRCIKSIAVIMTSAFANDLNPAIETPPR
jgi:hypothetical protein